MSLKDEFEKLDGDNQDKKSETGLDIEHYTTSASGRNLTFVQPNGDREFFNYADLVNAKYVQADDEIQLTFRTDTINKLTLKGRNLLSLFNSLAENNPKKISCIDKRYAATKEESEIVVTAIIIQRSVET